MFNKYASIRQIEDRINVLNYSVSQQAKHLEEITNHYFENLTLIASRSSLKNAIEEYLENPDQEHLSVICNILTSIDSMSIIDKNFIDIDIIYDNEIISSSNSNKIGKKLFLSSKAINRLSLYNLYFEFYKENINSQKNIAFSVPIKIKNDKIIILRATQYSEKILDLVGSIKYIGKTCEAVMAISDENGRPIFLRDSIENNTTQILENSSIGQALKGKEGFLKTIDYRGIDVYAAILYNEKLDCGIVVKIDVAEVLETTKTIKNIFLIFFISFLTVTFLLFVILVIIIHKYQTKTNKINKLLTKQTEMLSESIDNSPIGIALVGVDGSWLQVNKKLCDIVGYTEKELLTLKWQDITHPNDLLSDQYLVDKLLRKEQNTYELEKRYIKKTGEIIPIQLNVAAIKDENNNIRYFISQIQDISKKKELDENLERFAYIASHDLREPMRTISSYIKLYISQDSIDLESKSKKYFNYITDASDRMTKMIDDLLDYSRVGRNIKIFPNNVNEIIETAIADLDVEIKKTKTIISVKFMNSPILNCDETQIYRLFQNLLSNAIKFHSPGKPPQITITQYTEKENYIITVEDNGIGIDKENHQKIFNMFERGKNIKNGGSGMGLAICQKIAKVHHGIIRLESQINQGSKFIVSLYRKLEPTE